MRAIGASNYADDRLREALKISADNGLARYETLQPEYNLYDRAGYESGLEQVAVEHGLGVINYYSLASGFLSGKYRSKEDAAKSARGQGVVEKYLNDRGLKIVNALVQIADARHASPAQVALAWQIARPSVTAPIVSATSLTQVDELAKAAVLKLKDEDLRLLSEVSSY